MKQHTRHPRFFLPAAAFLLLVAACGQNTAGPVKEDHPATPRTAPEVPRDQRVLPKDFGAYWFAGEAELTSYELEQARYGEMREGHAVLIYVTEPFLEGKQVKADQNHPDNIQVLKLNHTKKFLTGIYPYSIMTSIFYPLYAQQHAVKLSASVQEWCGHVYTQLNNREVFELTSHSYFEKEADQQLRLEKIPLEDEIWTQLRVAPESLPLGKLQMLPALEYIRLAHKEMKAYEAECSLTETAGLSTYKISYPELGRTLSIQFGTAFPHVVEGWSESYPGGFGPDARVLTSKARKLRTLKTAYWEKNGNKDVILRDSLGL